MNISQRIEKLLICGTCFLVIACTDKSVLSSNTQKFENTNSTIIDSRANIRPTANWPTSTTVWTASLFASTYGALIGPNAYVTGTAGDTIEFQFGGQYNELTGEIGVSPAYVLFGDGLGNYTENSPFREMDEYPRAISSVGDVIDGNVYYLWTSEGGVFYTVNTAGTWSPVNELVAIDPTNFAAFVPYAKVVENPAGGATAFWITGVSGDFIYNAVDIAPGGTPSVIASLPVSTSAAGITVIRVLDAMMNSAGDLYAVSMNSNDVNDIFAEQEIAMHRYSRGKWSKISTDETLNAGQFRGIDIMASKIKLARAASGRVVVLLDVLYLDRDAFNLADGRRRRNLFSIWVNFSTGWDEKWYNLGFNMGFKDRDRVAREVQIAYNNLGDTVVAMWGEETILPSGEVENYILGSKFSNLHDEASQGHWSAPLRVSGTNFPVFESDPSIAITTDGRALAAWVTLDPISGTQELHTNQFDGIVWGMDEVSQTFNETTDGLVGKVSLNINSSNFSTMSWFHTVNQEFSRDYSIAISSLQL